MVQKLFEKIKYKKLLLVKPYNTYYIFKHDGEKIEVESNNAYEAIVKSGVKEPVAVKNILYYIKEFTVLSEDLKIAEYEENIANTKEENISKNEELH